MILPDITGREVFIAYAEEYCDEWVIGVYEDVRAAVDRVDAHPQGRQVRSFFIGDDVE